MEKILNIPEQDSVEVIAISVMCIAILCTIDVIIALLK